MLECVEIVYPIKSIKIFPPCTWADVGNAIWPAFVFWELHFDCWKLSLVGILLSGAVWKTQLR